ncbi:hypothetical protein CRENBAI_017868 [Crenichthys baileyi]|uniref:Uncharacterized protein n=1 Tax=Crenichthys baileyi TaxID=28760 RepID=A0AAV9RJ31_9TELE
MAMILSREILQLFLGGSQGIQKGYIASEFLVCPGVSSQRDVPQETSNGEVLRRDSDQMTEPPHVFSSGSTSPPDYGTATMTRHSTGVFQFLNATLKRYENYDYPTMVRGFGVSGQILSNPVALMVRSFAATTAYLYG